jgi:hypothetical protein
MGLLDELLAIDGVRAAAPAPASQISEVARWAGASLPESLVGLWQRTNGLALPPIDAHVLGAGEALEVAASAGWDELLEGGFLPIVDDHGSYYCAVVIKEPLAFRGAHVPHDGESRLLYCGVESCLRAIVDGMRRGRTLDLVLSETHGDYAPDGARSAEDEAAARALLDRGGARGSGATRPSCWTPATSTDSRGCWRPIISSDAMCSSA